MANMFMFVTWEGQPPFHMMLFHIGRNTPFLLSISLTTIAYICFL